MPPPPVKRHPQAGCTAIFSRRAPEMDVVASYLPSHFIRLKKKPSKRRSSALLSLSENVLNWIRLSHTINLMGLQPVARVRTLREKGYDGLPGAQQHRVVLRLWVAHVVKCTQSYGADLRRTFMQTRLTGRTSWPKEQVFGRDSFGNLVFDDTTHIYNNLLVFIQVLGTCRLVKSHSSLQWLLYTCIFF